MERTSTSRRRAGAKKSTRGSSMRSAVGRKSKQTRALGAARTTSTGRKKAASSSRSAAKRGGARKTTPKRAGKRRYGPKAKEKVGEVMHELKHGELRSSTGKKVKNPKQAIAIGLSEARRAGAQVPPRPRRAPKRKSRTAT